MHHRRTDTGANSCFAVTSQAFCQESCQFAVTKRNEIHRLLRRKSGDAIAQRCDRLVDCFRFLKPHAFWASLAKSFRACQINNCAKSFPIEILLEFGIDRFGSSTLTPIFLNPALLNKYLKDGVRPTWVFVHTGTILVSFLYTFFNVLQKLFFWVDMDLSQAFNEDSDLGVFTYLKVGLSSTQWRCWKLIIWCCRSHWWVWCCSLALVYILNRSLRGGTSWWGKKVSDLFHIDFKERYRYSELTMIWVFSFNIIKNLMDNSGNDSTLIVKFPTRFGTENCVCLSGSSLAVSHYDPVETIEHIGDNGCSQLFIGCFLVAVHRKNMVKHEVSLVKALSD